MRAMATRPSTVRDARHLGQRHVDGGEDDTQVPGRQHHDRCGHVVAVAAQFGQIFGVAGKGETRFVKHGLGDGGGDQAARRARPAKFHAGPDPVDDMRRMDGRRLACNGGLVQRPVEHGQGAGKNPAGFGGSGNARDRHTLLFQRRGVADDAEGEITFGFDGPPGLGHDFGADPAWIAKAQGQGRKRCHALPLGGFARIGKPDAYGLKSKKPSRRAGRRVETCRGWKI